MQSSDLQKIDEQLGRLLTKRSDLVTKAEATEEAARQQRLREAAEKILTRLNDLHQRDNNATRKFSQAVEQVCALAAEQNRARGELEQELGKAQQALYDAGASEAEVQERLAPFKPTAHSVHFLSHTTRRLWLNDVPYDLRDTEPQGMLKSFGATGNAVILVKRRD